MSDLPNDGLAARSKGSVGNRLNSNRNNLLERFACDRRGNIIASREDDAVQE